MVENHCSNPKLISAYSSQLVSLMHDHHKNEIKYLLTQEFINQRCFDAISV